MKGTQTPASTRSPVDHPGRRVRRGPALVFPILVLTLVLSLGLGSAASLGGLSPASLGAGSTPVTKCDADGFTYSFTVSLGVVTAVVVGGIADPGCEGGNLSLTLVDAAGANVGSGSATVAVDGDTNDNLVTVSLSVQPSLSSVAGVHTAITGP